jgi:FtsP/CotA-like multicopper oxidase with cupredoxin domain
MQQDLSLSSGERLRVPLEQSGSLVGLHIEATDTRPSLGGGAALIAPSHAGHDHDQEHFISIHHWLNSSTDAAGPLLGPGITYRHASLGGRLLQASEPIRVREGQRVRFHFHNASAATCVGLSLPRHRFRVLALDGYPVPRPQSVDQVSLGPGERVEALVHMTSPGRWILGAIDRRHRAAGLGRMIEYEHARGVGQHPVVARSTWNYAAFALPGPDLQNDAQRVEIEFEPAAQAAVSATALAFAATVGKPYRLSIANASGERHCISVRGHKFNVLSVAGAAMRGLIKDTISLPTFARTEVEFVAANANVEILHSARVTGR